MRAAVTELITYIRKRILEGHTVDTDSENNYIVNGMSKALAAVVLNYDTAKTELEGKLTAFASVKGGNFPKTIKLFRQTFPVFDPTRQLSDRNSRHRQKCNELADAYKTLLRHEHCFKLLSVPSMLRNLCFLSEAEFETLQMSAHPAKSLILKAEMYPRLRHCEPEVARELAFNLVSFTRSFTTQQMNEVHQVSAISAVQYISLMRCSRNLWL